MGAHSLSYSIMCFVILALVSAGCGSDDSASGGKSSGGASAVGGSGGKGGGTNTGGSGGSAGKAASGGAAGNENTGGAAGNPGSGGVAGSGGGDTGGTGSGGTGGSSGGSAGRGAGKSSYACPTGGIAVGATADLGAAVSSAGQKATLCVTGVHRISAPLAIKNGQTLIGIGVNAHITGGKLLTGWKQNAAGIWYYDGPAITTTPHLGPTDLGGNHPPCFDFSKYQDDVFFNDQRMLRVLDITQLTGSTLPTGQKASSVELGRLFYDYAAGRIYIDRDPTGATLEVSAVDHLLGGNGTTDVTLQNLFLEKTLDNGVPGGSGWQLTDCTVRFAHTSGLRVTGASATRRSIITRTIITNNGLYGVNGTGKGVTLDDCELSWNNMANFRGFNPSNNTCGGYWGAGAAKIVYSAPQASGPGLYLKNVESHHNIGDGFWTDIGNDGVLVEGGRLHHNERHGYFHEISCDFEMKGVEIDHNGLPIKNTWTSGMYSILLSDSNHANIHDNVIHDNPDGIVLQYVGHENMLNASKGCPEFASADDTDVTKTLMNNTINNNVVAMCTGTTGGKFADLAARKNVFTNNDYRVPNQTGSYWINNGKTLAFGAWNTAGYDAQGSAVAPCSYP